MPATRALRSLVVPTLFFLLWIGAGVLQPGVWSGEGPAGAAGMEVWGRRGYLIAAWLLGAVVVHRWLCVLVLDGLAARASGKPIQKIFKDVLGFGLLLGAGLAILVTVFGLSVSTFWAASGVLGIVLGIALGAYNAYHFMRGRQ